jgi:hypothetical protein
MTTIMTEMTTAELFRLYQQALVELKAREIIRTANSPQGDYAEWLVQRAVGGILHPNSHKSWDVTTSEGERLQFKCRVVSTPMRPSHSQLSAFRSFDFDAAIVVLFSDIDFSVLQAVKVPSAVVEAQAAGGWQEISHSWRAFANAALLDHPDSVDVTNRVRSATME